MKTEEVNFSDLLMLFDHASRYLDPGASIKQCPNDKSLVSFYCNGASHTYDILTFKGHLEFLLSAKLGVGYTYEGSPSGQSAAEESDDSSYSDWISL